MPNSRPNFKNRDQINQFETNSSKIETSSHNKELTSIEISQFIFQGMNGSKWNFETSSTLSETNYAEFKTKF
jgi:hypothetical protein